MVIREISEGDADAAASISNLLDDDAQIAATRRFLTSSGHHLLVAYENAGAVGFVTGVEMTHPDKGTEASAQRSSLRWRIVHGALGATGCGFTDQDNVAAMRAYTAAGGIDPREHTMISWTFEEHP